MKASISFHDASRDSRSARWAASSCGTAASYRTKRRRTTQRWVDEDARLRSVVENADGVVTQSPSKCRCVAARVRIQSAISPDKRSLTSRV